MTAKLELNTKIEAIFRDNPHASVEMIRKLTGASPRNIYYVKSALRRQGKLSPGRRSPAPKTLNISVSQPILDDDTLRAMAMNPNLAEDYGTEVEIQTKLLREVQKIAFDTTLSPDTRLSASQIWVKLKDIARSKDLGPGPPRSEEEIVERLIRIMQGVGPQLVVKSLERAFKKGPVDEKPSNKQETSPPGASDPPDSPGYDNLDSETP